MRAETTGGGAQSSELKRGAIRLMEISWKDAEQAIRDDRLVLVPIGSIEQHGFHLPLGTDSFIAEAVAMRAADRLDAIVAPTICYTPHSRPAHGGGDKRFSGSVGVPGRLVEELVRHLTGDLFRQGFRRVVYVNNHYENIAPLAEALSEVTERFEGCKAMRVDLPDLFTEDLWAEIIPNYRGFRTEHAAVSEASCIAAVRPDLFSRELAGRGGIERDERYDVFPAPDELVAPTGMLGDASDATPEIGERIYEIAAAGIVAAIERDLQ